MTQITLSVISYFYSLLYRGTVHIASRSHMNLG